jgi:hypothetical protein
VPILPIVDLLILSGTGSLIIGFILKAVSVATHYNPAIMGFSSVDFVLVAGVCLALALTLVARSWLKLNEPAVMAMRGQIGEERARERGVLLAQQMDMIREEELDGR